MTTASPPVPRVPTRRQVLIELLALDLESCGRCTRTDANLEAALGSVATILRESEVDVRVEKHVVRSAEQAERLRFVSSPTIRVNGRDIALDLRESPCDDCGELCGCGGGVACRVWVWRGQEYLEAPKPMIVEAVLRAYARVDDPTVPPGSYELPENLRAFFSALGTKGAGEAHGGCCETGPNPQKCC
jgi:hypothetical protein